MLLLRPQQFGSVAAADGDGADPLGALPEGILLLPSAPVPVVLVPVLCAVPVEPDDDGAPDIALFSRICPLCASRQWVFGDTVSDGEDADWAEAENAPPAMTAAASITDAIFMGCSLLFPS